MTTYLQSEELETARRAKDVSLAQKEEMAKKLDVLTTYFNQRESEMQKQASPKEGQLTLRKSQKYMQIVKPFMTM